MLGQGLGFASSLRCALTTSTKSRIQHELLHESRAPEKMVPTRPAAPEMVLRPAAVGEAPSPDGRVLSDLASSCLAYGAVVALLSSACGLAHRSVGYTYESSRQIRVVSGLLVRVS